MPLSDETVRLYASFDPDGENHVGPIDYRLHLKPRNIGGVDRDLPAKLGEGNYGIVFDARDTGIEQDWAIKVLYASPRNEAGDVEEDRRKRIVDELTVGGRIVRSLREILDHADLGADDDFRGIARHPGNYIVLPVTNSQDLVDFPGRREFRAIDVNLSGYAYAMEKFECSLKDLVEHAPDDGSPESGPKSRNDGEDADAPDDAAAPVENGAPVSPVAQPSLGYTRLADVPILERERSAVPVLESVARGLQVLHAASLRHQDIKPANIFYRNAAGRVDFRLGDLGFLSPQNPRLQDSAGITASRNFLGIGTRHYRSIEQIDYCDSAECDVTVMANDPARAMLKTFDPKFLQTNIQVGDKAFFAKSDHEQFLVIESIKRGPDASTILKVALLEEAAQGADMRFLVDDENVQVSFVKNPSARTDLFGLGAIFYDILTAGASPERFYELLRRFDVPDTGIDTIILKYEVWKSGLLDDPDLGAIFSRLNGGERIQGGVDPKVLAFLLRCMMSNAHGSFYRDFGFAEAQIPPTDDRDALLDARVVAVGAWAKVIGEIEKLGTRLRASRYSRVDRNALTRKVLPREDEWEDDGPIESNAWKPVDVLAAYRRGLLPRQIEEGGKEERPAPVLAPVPFRWVMGTSFLARLRPIPGDQLSDPAVKMVSLAPERLRVDERGISKRGTAIFDGEESLIAQLVARDPLITRIRPFAHRFEPIWWRFGSRRIMLDKLQLAAEAREDGWPRLTATLAYADFSGNAWQPRPGDFVLPNDGGAPLVLRIASIEGDEVVFDVCFERSDETMRDRAIGAAQAVSSGYLVQNPDPVDYYAGMIGVYLYHFLIGDEGHHRDFPAVAYHAAEHFPVNFGASPRVGKENGARCSLDDIRRHVIRLTAWLSLGGYHFTAKGDGIGNGAERWNAVNEEVRHWIAKADDYAGTSISGWHLLYGQETFADTTLRKLEDKFSEPVSAAGWNDEIDKYLPRKKGFFGLG